MNGEGIYEMKLRIADVFQDNMVIQRRKVLTVFGECGEAGEVAVTVNDAPVCRQRLKKGKFRIKIPPLEAAEDVVLTVGDRRFEHVDIGEVWIAGGQSNMEFSLEKAEQGEKIWRETQDPHFRMYTSGRYSCEKERENCHGSELAWDRWISCENIYTKKFSAVAFFSVWN
mgnify:CR=1 FL=1